MHKPILMDPLRLLLLLSTLQVVKAVVPALPESLLPRGLQLLPALCACLKHINGAVRLASARYALGLGSLLALGVCAVSNLVVYV
jgi:hypothetical protein